VFFSVSAQSTDDEVVERCATHLRDLQKQTLFPDWRRNRQQTEQAIQQYMRQNSVRLRVSAESDVVRIPVVVHVIHDQAPTLVGGLNNPNISEEQIKSQIQVLNEDFRRILGTNGHNTSALGADTGIEFFLAEFDPQGKPTNGITRTQYTVKNSFDPFADDALLSSLAYWPSDQYLNIWVCRLTSGYLGIAQFPAVQGVPGLDALNEAFERTDGAIIDFRYFGRRTGAITSRIYNLGRTTTHEIGHWLGLIHTWGDTDCGTDYCDDTPQAFGPNRTTVCTPVFSNCGGVRTRNMIENYLDYSPDSCMSIFTRCQAERMRTILELSPRRAKLVENARKARLESTPTLTVTLVNHPALGQERPSLKIQFPEFQDIDILVYTTTGQEYKRLYYPDSWSRQIELDTQQWEKGVYFVKVKVREEAVVKRMVVL
jgi:hypothetical protein